MTERTSSLTERYVALTDEELQSIAIEGGLTDDARELLDQELRRRGIVDVGKYKQYLQGVDQKRLTAKRQALQRKEKSIRLYVRTGHGISIFGILTGLFALHSERREHHQHDLAFVGLDYCLGSAAGVAFLAATIKFRLKPCGRTCSFSEPVSS